MTLEGVAITRAVKSGAWEDLRMDGFREGQQVWVEQDDGTQRAGVYVGEVQTTSWLGGAPAAYVVYEDTRSSHEVALPRITPRDDA